jgi:hypothetical protein
MSKYEDLRIETIDWLQKIKDRANELRNDFTNTDKFQEKLSHLHVMFSMAETKVIDLHRLQGEGETPWQ